MKPLYQGSETPETAHVRPRLAGGRFVVYAVHMLRNSRRIVHAQTVMGTPAPHASAPETRGESGGSESRSGQLPSATGVPKTVMIGAAPRAPELEAAYCSCSFREEVTRRRRWFAARG